MYFAKLYSQILTDTLEELSAVLSQYIENENLFWNSEITHGLLVDTVSPHIPLSAGLSDIWFPYKTNPFLFC